MRHALYLAALVLVCMPSPATAQPLPKARVGELIRAVEDGVDEFRNYLEKRGEDARDRSSGKQKGGRDRDTAKAKSDDLDDALGELNRSTNRLRRKFDATDSWMETKSEVQSVVDDARKVNQIVERGNHGTEAGRVWGTLRTRINELARAYGVAPLGR